MFQPGKPIFDGRDSWDVSRVQRVWTATEILIHFFSGIHWIHHCPTEVASKVRLRYLRCTPMNCQHFCWMECRQDLDIVPQNVCDASASLITSPFQYPSHLFRLKHVDLNTWTSCKLPAESPNTLGFECDGRNCWRHVSLTMLTFSMASLSQKKSVSLPWPIADFFEQTPRTDACAGWNENTSMIAWLPTTKFLNQIPILFEASNSHFVCERMTRSSAWETARCISEMPWAVLGMLVHI